MPFRKIQLYFFGKVIASHECAQFCAQPDRKHVAISLSGCHQTPGGTCERHWRLSNQKPSSVSVAKGFGRPWIWKNGRASAEGPKWPRRLANSLFVCQARFLVGGCVNNIGIYQNQKVTPDYKHRTSGESNQRSLVCTVANH